MITNLFASLLLTAASPMAEANWTSEIVYQAQTKVGGCAVGDLRPDIPGLEIAIVCGNGEVYVLARGRSGWTSELAYRAPGEMIQCAIGEVDEARPGDELVVVGIASGGEDSGGPGAAHWIWRDGSGWKGQEIFGAEALVHGVCIARGSIFVTGYDRLAHRVYRADDLWTSEVIAELPGAGKSAVAFDRGVAFACTNGSVVVAKRNLPAWTTEVLDERDAGRARLAAHGPRLVVADDDGTLSVLEAGNPIRMQVGSAKLRGAALGDLDPTTPGLEAATAGYGRAVTILYPRGKTWAQRPVFTDTDRLHHLASGDVDGDGRLELVVCGYSGRIVLLDCEAFD